MSGRRRLHVNIVDCEGIGICAHLAPDVVRVDSWGFPILDQAPLDRATARQAEAAVNACPRRALFVTTTEGTT
jgi:ferredoxin